MVRVAIALFLSMLLPSGAQAQIIREHQNEGGVRSFHGVGAVSRITRSFQSDAEARAEFERILSTVGLNWIADRISLRASAQIPNAEAGISKDGERFIFYNALFMQKVKQRTAEHWSLVSILAHEVGHHLAFHTQIEGRYHEFELEADYFSGFVLRRLGATLDQAHAAMKDISPKEATATHPGLDDRLHVITIGWTDGGSSGPPRGLKGPLPSTAAPQPSATAAEQAALATPSPPPSPPQPQPASPPFSVGSGLVLKLQSAFPKRQSQLGPNPDAIAESIVALTDGRLRVHTFAAGEIVLSAQILDAASKNIIDIGWAPADLFARTESAFGVLSGAVPFGLPAEKLVTWAQGDGKELRDRVYGKAGVRALACHVLGSSGGWYRKQIQRAADLKGLKLRVSGLAASVLIRAGGMPQQMAAAEILPALERGVLDGASYSTPQLDVPMEFSHFAKYFFFPGWHQPATLVDLIVSKARWDSLPVGHQQAIRAACQSNLLKSLTEIATNDKAALAALAGQGVQIVTFPKAVLDALQRATNEVLNEASLSLTSDFKEVLASYNKAR